RAGGEVPVVDHRRPLEVVVGVRRRGAVHLGIGLVARTVVHGRESPRENRGRRLRVLSERSTSNAKRQNRGKLGGHWGMTSKNDKSHVPVQGSVGSNNVTRLLRSHGSHGRPCFGPRGFAHPTFRLELPLYRSDDRILAVALRGVKRRGPGPFHPWSLISSQRSFTQGGGSTWVFGPCVSIRTSCSSSCWSPETDWALTLSGTFPSLSPLRCTRKSPLAFTGAWWPCTMTMVPGS